MIKLHAADFADHCDVSLREAEAFLRMMTEYEAISLEEQEEERVEHARYLTNRKRQTP